MSDSEQKAGKYDFGDMANVVATPLSLPKNYGELVKRKPVPLNLPGPTEDYLAKHPFHDEEIWCTFIFL